MILREREIESEFEWKGWEGIGNMHSSTTVENGKKIRHLHDGLPVDDDWLL